MSDDRPNDKSSVQGGTSTCLDEKTLEAIDKYIQSANHAAAHVAATHDRRLLDRLWLEVAAIFNRRYTALHEIDSSNPEMDN